MKVLTEPIKKEELKKSEYLYGNEMVKGVVDVEKELLAVDAEMHADIEQALLEQGSNQYNLWGINLYFDADGEDLVEFDSMINVRPAQGNRSRAVEDADTQEKIRQVVAKWVK